MIYNFDSPLGVITYDWSQQTCQHIWLNSVQRENSGHHDPVSDYLHAYFSGQRHSLPELAAPKTTFQLKLRRGLLNIPCGAVRTYGELARQLGTSAQGLGQALGANPFPILIPCHRIIAAKGPGGFAYGPIWKEKLLAFES